MPKQFSPKTIALVFSVLVICSVAAFYAAAWTEPTAVAPGNNASTPLDTSNVGQTKVGGLVLNTGAATYGLIVQSGNVGIGTATPGAKLEVAGQIKMTGGTPGTDKVLISDSSGLAGWEGNTFVYYCYTSSYSNDIPRCSDAGGTQRHCPTGTIQKRALGVWGDCGTPTTSHLFNFFPGGRCLGNGNYADVQGVAFLCTLPDKSAVSKIVFATSQKYDGNLGGIAGANAKCQSAATAAGLSGTYYAWVSISFGDDPFIRFSRHTGPYVLRNGTKIADDFYDLTSGNLIYAINMDQNGSAVSGNVWTGTRWSGFSSGNQSDQYVNCNGWSTNSDNVKGYYGVSTSNSSTWSEYGGYVLCSQQLSLYCFQQ